MAQTSARVRVDKWAPTVCGGCIAMCTVKARVVDGVVVKIEGNPEAAWGGRGGICAKAQAQLQVLYDPNRVNYPVRRTNPEKGIGVDPKWQRISWGEAMDEIAGRLDRIRKDDPRKLLLFGGLRYANSVTHYLAHDTFAIAYGTPNWTMGGAGLYCGNSTHTPAGMNYATWSFMPDWSHCNYAVFFATGQGAGSGDNTSMLARRRGNAAAKGIRTVGFDCLCHTCGGKATEWVPILPGTDGIVCLAMANVLVNELGIYDREYLKKKTNASYLIKEDGRYARDDGGEPLMWDAADGRAKNWKQPVAGPALEGSFEVNGVKCRPVFAALREHLKQYTPERASEISTVPAAIIRRIAAEFGENARIGSTIEIQGFKLPYRPAAAATYMAATAHTNGFHTWFAVDLLNQLVGSAGAVGGASGMAQGRLLGYPGTGFPRYEPVAGKDGFISAEIAPGMTEWPHEKPKLPGSLILAELFPTSPHFSPWPLARDSAELYQKLGIDYQVEAMFGFGGNLAMNTADIEDVAAFLKSVPFLAVSEIYHNETTEGFADIVLPDCHALESMSIMESEYWAYAWPPHLEPNEYRLRQAVVPPMYERRACPDVIIELVDRLGMREEWNKTLNWYFCRFAGCPDLFRPDDRCSWEETVDRLLQQKFGPEHNIEWFKEHGFISWPKRVEETYWRQFADARSHIYLEWLVDQEEETRAICQPRGIELDWAQFTPLISWTPPVPFKEGDHSFDLYTVTFTDPLHCSTWTHGIPWIAEVSDTNPYLYHILLNTMTAKEKGIKDGDEVYVESVRGRRLEGMVHTIEGIHPRCVAMSIGTGKWARGQPLARGKGPCINRIQPLDLEHVCPISLNIESTVKVKVSKKGEGPK